jgi:uncharacterized protein DUF4387
MTSCATAASYRVRPSAGSSASTRRKSPITSPSSRRWRSKFTIYRRMPSGSPGDADIFGSQQYGPLLDIEVPYG